MKIDKHVPIPFYKANTKSIYPFSKLKVGDSFFTEISTVDSVRGSAKYFEKNNPNKQFLVRKVDGGVRVWRIK